MYGRGRELLQRYKPTGNPRSYKKNLHAAKTYV
jgi:hypothetical protein